MELMQLEMFVAVVETGSVRGAAERVYRTQPAVSMAVRKLEEEFSTPLFDRSKRYEFRLTHAGESLYRYAKRMLSLRKQATSELDDISKLRVGRLRVGANESISLHLLPKLAKTFLKKYPATHMELTCARSDTLLADLRLRKLDLALVSFRPQDADFESSFILQDELVLITHPNHALALRTKVQFQDLAGEPLLMMDVSQPSPWHKRVTDAFVRSKIPYHLQVDNAPIETIKKMVAMDLGLGFVPLLCVREERDRGELAIVDVEGFHEERSVWLVRRWGHDSPGAEAFSGIAVEFGEEVQHARTVQRPRFLPDQRSIPTKDSKLIMVKRGV